MALATGSGPAWAQLSRADAAGLGLRAGDTVWVTVRDGDHGGHLGEVPAGAVSAASAGPPASA